MEFFLYLALVPTLGVVAQWIAWRTRLPGILLLLGFGILLGLFMPPDLVLERLTGADELQRLTGKDLAVGSRLLFPIVSLSVAVILLEGGLSLRINELREAGAATFRLVTVGAAITMALTALAAYGMLGFSWRLSLLLGAILTVTGPTVIGPLLRQIRPARRVASTLKWEGIVIDPVGAVLAVIVFEELLVHSASFSFLGAAWLLFRIIAIGAGLGVAGGSFLAHAFYRFWIPDHLHGVTTLAMALGLFSISNALAEESGLITVTILGMWLANQKKAPIEHVIEFKEHLRSLLIGCLFILLGSRLDLSEVVNLGLPGLGFLAFMILIVRPLSVFLSLPGTPLDFRERVFLGFMAPRGIVAAAVSSVFALKLAQSDTSMAWDGADQLVTVTFLVIAGTVAIYGTLSGLVARALNLAQPNPQGCLIAGAEPWVRAIGKALVDQGFPVLLIDTNYNKVSAAKMNGVPADCINVLSDHARVELDLAEMGRMLAMTPNDEVNSLAIREFQTIFGRADLYQLEFSHTSNSGRRALSESLGGRTLFSERLTFDEFSRRFDAGATIKTTKLSQEFLWDDFRNRYGDSAEVLFVFGEDKQLQINTVAMPITPVAGQTVICLVS